MAETRIALVIGNANYQCAPKLAKPANDARAVAAKFQTLGFVTEILENQTLDGLRKAFRAFREKVATAEIVAVYYAGHGIEVLGKNYLVPVDAQLRNPKTIADIEDEVYALPRILEDTEDARVLQLIILDCCRDDPFGDITRSLKGLTRDMTPHRGLALPSRLEGNTLIAFAAEPGHIAYDGEEDEPNSPYVTALLAHIGTPGDDVQRAFNRIRAAVIEKTKQDRLGKPRTPQAPFCSVGIRAPAIYLAPDPAEAQWQEIKLATAPLLFEEFLQHFPEHERAKEARLRLVSLRQEEEDWNRIKDENDRNAFAQFLASWPNGAHAAPARTRLKALGPEPWSAPDVWGRALVGLAGIGTAVFVGVKLLFKPAALVTYACWAFRASWCPVPAILPDNTHTPALSGNSNLSDILPKWNPSCPIGQYYSAIVSKCVPIVSSTSSDSLLTDCPAGQTYNYLLSKCAPPLTLRGSTNFFKTPDCLSGETYSLTEHKCVATAPIQPLTGIAPTLDCPDGQFYSPFQEKCIGFGSTTPSAPFKLFDCPAGQTYSFVEHKCTVGTTLQPRLDLDSVFNCKPGTHYNIAQSKCVAAK